MRAGFVRIVSNPAFSRDAVSPEPAAEVLEENLRHPKHQFRKDQIGFVETVRPFARKMLGLAFRRGGALATLDRGIEALLPDQTKRGLLEMAD